jgi:Mrp family chromosome partitioning ATPase/predicted Fe-Mo cluster-binding NifX family protein
MSGKGGVGKSTITVMVAKALAKKGYKVGIMDADITGPSIPRLFAAENEQAYSTKENYIIPVEVADGIKILSLTFLMKNESDPVIWRGPVIAGVVKQFYTDVLWGDLDVLLIDMPPGTGDVPLTVFQSIAVDGIIVVTSPQELVSMIVSKAVKMAEMMNIPIIGLVENMSYFTCPDNGKDYHIFGDSHIEEIADNHNLKVLAKLPIDPKISAACDKGMIELFDGNWFDPVAKILAERMEEKETIKIAVASEKEIVTEHFGHCINFNIFEAENGQITKSNSIPNPGHKPGFLPNFLNDMGVNVIISGGMGEGAIDIFHEKGIEVIVGASGNAKDAVNAYLKGTLKSTGSVCREHQHHDECGE